MTFSLSFLLPSHVCLRFFIPQKSHQDAMICLRWRPPTWSQTRHLKGGFGPLGSFLCHVDSSSHIALGLCIKFFFLYFFFLQTMKILNQFLKFYFEGCHASLWAIMKTGVLNLGVLYLCPQFHGSVDSQWIISVMACRLQRRRDHVFALLPRIEIRTQNRPFMYVNTRLNNCMGEPRDKL